jgi:hypothetical protein
VVLLTAVDDGAEEDDDGVEEDDDGAEDDDVIVE